MKILTADPKNITIETNCSAGVIVRPNIVTTDVVFSPKALDTRVRNDNNLSNQTAEHVLNITYENSTLTIKVVYTTNCLDLICRPPVFVKQIPDHLFHKLEGVVVYDDPRTQVKGHMLWFNISGQPRYCFTPEGQNLSEQCNLTEKMFAFKKQCFASERVETSNTIVLVILELLLILGVIFVITIAIMVYKRQQMSGESSAKTLKPNEKMRKEKSTVARRGTDLERRLLRDKNTTPDDNHLILCINQITDHKPLRRWRHKSVGHLMADFYARIPVEQPSPHWLAGSAEHSGTAVRTPMAHHLRVTLHMQLKVQSIHPDSGLSTDLLAFLSGVLSTAFSAVLSPFLLTNLLAILSIGFLTGVLATNSSTVLSAVLSLAFLFDFIRDLLFAVLVAAVFSSVDLTVSLTILDLNSRLFGVSFGSLSLIWPSDLVNGGRVLGVIGVVRDLIRVMAPVLLHSYCE
ncbi:unnamed protein product [Medioppia subpectinata]|uniref:Uncharacterized protein n=1 Tax=Medioppia subpectinata TaxID=1979941 RepID=A0A7R9KIP0_9ACAR|nr:unnamed protein product [Medioppia subpectinata]CAG2104405.1 unnamed protein product [Medioppia subpectinata]